MRKASLVILAFAAVLLASGLQHPRGWRDLGDGFAMDGRDQVVELAARGDCQQLSRDLALWSP